MKTGRRFDVGKGVRAGKPRPFFSLEDADREWLLFLFASLAQEDADLTSLLAGRAERELKMRTRPGGFPGRDRRFREDRRSPGRRLGDLLTRWAPDD